MEENKRRKRGSGCIYRINKDSGNWYIKYYFKGKPQYENSGSAKKKIAEDILKERLANKTLGQLNPEATKVTFEDMEENILLDYSINKKRSLDRLKLSLENLRATFGGNRAETITVKRIKAYAHTAQAEGAANATINRDLSALRRMFNLAIEAEMLSRRPKIKMLKEDNVRKGFFEVDDFQALMNALPDYLRPMVTFAYHTGWRKGEILSLKWNQVDLSEKMIRLNPDQAKNGLGRTVAIDDDLLAILRAQYQARKVVQLDEQAPTVIGSYVFHNRGKPIRDFRAAWVSALKKAKLNGKIFHDLRRTAIRTMIRAGVAEHTAMSISGHRTRSVFDRYDIVNEEDLREAAKKTSARIRMQMSAATVRPISEESVNG